MFHGFCKCGALHYVFLLIAGILRISAIMLVGCVCHSVCLSVCVFVYPVAATPFQRSRPNWVQTSAMVKLRHLSFLVNLGQRSRSRSPKTEILIFAITSAKMVVSTSNQIQNVHLPILHPTICLIGVSHQHPS